MDVMSKEAGSEHLPSVSVIVLCFNQRLILQRLLPQLLAEKYPGNNHEIIVIDGGSEDGTQEWLSTLQHAFLSTLFENRQLSRSQLRNKGIRAAAKDIVIMLDGDHTIEKDFIHRHAVRHRERECVVLGESRFIHSGRLRALHRYLNTRGVRKVALGATVPGRYFRTCNCSVPRSVLEQIGFFDESFTSWGGEDLDFGVRIEESGIPILYEPHAKAWHHHLRPLNELLRNLRIYGEDSIGHLVEKHPQLYRELNLHRLEKASTRFLMQAPLYYSIRLLTNLLLPLCVPSIVFDYLHLRQYGFGFLHSKTKRGK
jgi:glycosyltransferase involved in cell wall biosynthesis